MRTACVLMLLVVVALLADLNAAAEEGGGQGAAFLRLPAGVRATGMGGAFASVADDVEALYYNPAGLQQTVGVSASASYCVLSMDRVHYDAGLVLAREDLGAVGVMVVGFGTGDIDGRTPLGDPAPSFDDSEMAFILAGSKRLLGPVAVGGGLKFIRQSLADNGATGIAFDVGIHTRGGVSSGVLTAWRAGACASDLGGQLTWDTASDHEDEIPATFRYGAALDVRLAQLPVVVAVEGWTTPDEPTELHVGLEARPWGAVALRAGLADGELCFGGGFGVGMIRIDYSYLEDFLGEGGSHRLGVVGAF